MADDCRLFVPDTAVSLRDCRYVQLHPHLDLVKQVELECICFLCSRLQSRRGRGSDHRTWLGMWSLGQDPCQPYGFHPRCS